MLTRLYDRFTPGGLLHEGQGKWYPGEPLPRWALTSYFRNDGVPIWNDPGLFAREATGPDSADDARTFIRALATALGADPKFATPSYEDAWYYLWRERRLPINVDPFDSHLEDEVERARLAKVFEQGLTAVVGYALPIARNGGGPGARWKSGPWFLRPERLYLVPGDSPMGFRLPQDGLPWAAPGDRTAIHERDPFAPREPLPPRFRGRSEGPAAGAKPGDAGPPTRHESFAGMVRTALCIEPRSGVLHVFMPPVALLEDYLELCAAIEGTAASLRKQVRIEGYQPPADLPWLGRFVGDARPGSGFIEVNVHPARDWNELAKNTEILYEEARNVGLRAEKFMLDGRHTGTGGGNHVVLGGGHGPRTARRSARPDLLRSLVTYWQNHPSLSFMFSGMFVGPTSQAPRVDEARNDSLYELEIAFRKLGDGRGGAGEPPPWLVDRLFRNLLIDVTGNTHRTEFCIDKLYSPDSASGRQGINELRSFEMPPHARMSLAQQLLVRALVAKFWHEPYRQSLVRWGTSIHDRFALPHFIRDDFGDVLEDLVRSGFPFDASWFAPHYEFRFPVLGTLEARGGVVLELRQAIEPWNVLGEEVAAGGTARYVDSSVERVEVKVLGMVDERHVVTCNGRRVPLQPTGTNGKCVAGVRYRAWQPPSALHPTIPVHAPLVFDVVDRWNERAIAGCTYHVSHPGGRSNELFPRNGLEAESRRLSRFLSFGHTPGAQPAGAPRRRRERARLPDDARPAPRVERRVLYLVVETFKAGRRRGLPSLRRARPPRALRGLRYVKQLGDARSRTLLSGHGVRRSGVARGVDGALARPRRLRGHPRGDVRRGGERCESARRRSLEVQPPVRVVEGQPAAGLEQVEGDEADGIRAREVTDGRLDDDARVVEVQRADVEARDARHLHLDLAADGVGLELVVNLVLGVVIAQRLPHVRRDVHVGSVDGHRGAARVEAQRDVEPAVEHAAHAHDRVVVEEEGDVAHRIGARGREARRARDLEQRG